MNVERPLEAHRKMHTLPDRLPRSARLKSAIPRGEGGLRQSLLTVRGSNGIYHCVTTPGSFGERARSRSERDGSCIFREWK
jgi:hypothetical protein